jgi:hypothetical protein
MRGAGKARREAGGQQNHISSPSGLTEPIHLLCLLQRRRLSAEHRA